MKILPVSGFRASCGAIAFGLISAGAGLLWGWGGALLTLGLFIGIDTSIDEAIERITEKKRGFPSEIS